MCFYNDYDWTAEVCNQSTSVSSGQKCMECGRTIPVGSPLHEIYMQEHDECRLCSDGDCTCDVDGYECCSCSTPEFGETFDYQRCDDCHHFLEAIKAAEIEAGCHPNESQPSLCAMCEEIGSGNGSIEEARKYFKKAVFMFPHLKTSGYLAMIYKMMF